MKQAELLQRHATRKRPASSVDLGRSRVTQLCGWGGVGALSPREEKLQTLQRQAESSPGARETAQLATRVHGKGGMPANLQAGLEQLSGMDLSDVRVRYNSPKPAQLAAHAYAQGSEIHLAPGQEKHLPHEGWHVVQQRQGRVRPTTELGGTAINDDPGLEREADLMGARALRSQTAPEASREALQKKSSVPGLAPVQAALDDDLFGDSDDDTNYLSIKITEPAFQTWTRDVEDIDFEQDLGLFQEKVTAANPQIASVGTYQGVGDHVEVFARTETGEWVKMDMSGAGSRIIYPADGPGGHQVDDVDYTLKPMRLHDLFKAFFEVAKAKKFDFQDYNCQRFACNLMSALVDYEESDLFM